MAANTRVSETVIVLSSSDEEPDPSNLNNQVKDFSNLEPKRVDCPAMNRNGEQHLPTLNSKSNLPHSDEGSSSSGSLDPDILIELLLSSVRPLIGDADSEKIKSKVYILKGKCQENYLHSSDFRKRITSAVENLKKDPKNVFVHIKDVCDDMKAYRNKSLQNGSLDLPSTSAQSPSKRENLQTASESHIRKLEKLLEKLDRKIRKLKKKEISLDEMDDNCSAYIYEDRLMKRFRKVWEKLCELKKCSSKLKNSVDKKYKYDGSRYPEVNCEIERLLNTSKMFPDYCDVLKLVSSVSETSSLGLSESSKRILAQEVFQDIGRMLKERRVKDYKVLFGSYLTDNMDLESDPAEMDPALKEKLEKSYIEGQDKLQKVLREFTEKQEILKVEPKEVPDEDEMAGSDKDVDDPDDEEEDKEIENEQREEEIYSDDEKIKQYLEEPACPIDEDIRSPSLRSSSDEEKDTNTSEIPEVCGDIIQESPSNFSTSESTSNIPVRNEKKDCSATFSSSSKSCMPRLKVTPLKATLSESYTVTNVVPSQGPGEHSELPYEPSSKRMRFESRTVNYEKSVNSPEPEIIILD